LEEPYSCVVNRALWNHQKLAAMHEEPWGVSSQIKEVNLHSAAESLSEYSTLATLQVSMMGSAYSIVVVRSHQFNSIPIRHLHGTRPGHVVTLPKLGMDSAGRHWSVRIGPWLEKTKQDIVALWLSQRNKGRCKRDVVVALSTQICTVFKSELVTTCIWQWIQ
jgi:hypothetical protein